MDLMLFHFTRLCNILSLLYKETLISQLGVEYSPIHWLNLAHISIEYPVLDWLVVYLPIWKILVSWDDMGWLFPIYGKIKNVPNQQPVEIVEISIFGQCLHAICGAKVKIPLFETLPALPRCRKPTSKNSSDIYGHVSKSTVPTPKLYSLVLHPGKWIIIPVLSEVALLAHLYSGLIVGWITKTTNWSIASSFLAHAEFSKQIWQALFLRSRYQIVPISTKHGDCLISSTDSREIDRNITMQSVESIWNIAIQLVVFRLPQPEKWWSEWVTVGMIFYSLFCFWKVIKFHGSKPPTSYQYGDFCFPCLFHGWKTLIDSSKAQLQLSRVFRLKQVAPGEFGHTTWARLPNGKSSGKSIGKSTPLQVFPIPSGKLT